MRKRLLCAVLTLAAAVPAQPAPAAPPAYAVWEITRARAGGPGEVRFLLIGHGDGGPGLMGFIQLAPRKGGGWTDTKFHLGMYGNEDTRFTTYGTPTPPPQVACPGPADVCGAAGTAKTYGLTLTFRPAAGNRYFVFGPVDKFSTWLPEQWRARPVALGARMVLADTATAAGGVATGKRVEAFVSATAPGGKYGSGAFSTVPCRRNGNGSATLDSEGSEPATEISCDSGYWAGFNNTHDGRTWTVTGPVIGEYDWPFRLFVVDYPKR